MRIARRTGPVIFSLLLAWAWSDHYAFGQTEARQASVFTGAGSCSAAGCHGGNGTRPKFALPNRSTEDYSAHSTWIQKDPHARAYQVLLEVQSVKILERLGKNWTRPAHQEARCLACHSTYDLKLAAPETGDVAVSPVTHDGRIWDMGRLSDGVSCEACHGPAKDWLGSHTEAGWRDLSPDTRLGLGFKDLRHNLVERARACAACHVGSEGRDVNHDLIAAGHPRLNFEFAAYHANLPTHWNQEQDRQAFRPQAVEPNAGPGAASIRETKLWLVGQLASSEAALNLLESRARAAAANRGIWPEFSEYSCYACHHDLQSPSWRQSKTPLLGRKPGSYPWGTWTYPMLEALEADAPKAPWNEQLAKLNTSMSHPSPSLADVLRLTAEARQELAKELDKHRQPASMTARHAQELLHRITVKGQQISSRDWDGAAQTYLATIALYQGRLESAGEGDRLRSSPTSIDEQVLKSLTTLREKLQFPDPQKSGERINSPRSFDTDRIKLIQAELRRIEAIAQGQPSDQ